MSNIHKFTSVYWDLTSVKGALEALEEFTGNWDAIYPLSDKEMAEVIKDAGAKEVYRPTPLESIIF